MIATCSVMLAVVSLVVQPLFLLPLHAQNVSSTDISMGNTTGSNVTSQSSAQILEKLDAEMDRLLKSDDPKDIATLAYIWGFAPVSEQRKVDFTTSPNTPPGPGRGPINSLVHFRELTDSNFTDLVKPNSDTIYTTIFMDLKKEPLVLKIPPIKDRYYVLQIMDAYTDFIPYHGTRTNETDGGTFMFTGPNWNGTVPQGITEIKAPQNLVWNIIRILVDGPKDVPNVNALQDQFTLSPLSVYEGKNTSSVTTEPNTSKEIPIKSSPELIPLTGIKIYDEISDVLADNPPPKTDDNVVTKFKTIGIAAGKVPSTEANDTIRMAFENGIVEGEKLIDEKVKNLGSNVNGWQINLNLGRYGTDYLLRAAIANSAIGANIPEEAVYPITLTDIDGKLLSGANKYVIHFNKDQFPPLKELGFWSVTLYNDILYLSDNPLNRYVIGDRTEGLKYNNDGSLDIYIQNENPGQDKESNWLPAPTGNFVLTLRMYMPQESILKGEYQPPAIQRVV